jgi:protein-S-isoprenylcysteine O-methyltransferase Ste14
MFGFVLQWPTILTLAVFPVLVWMYVRLAREEERDAMLEFGGTYTRYAPRKCPGSSRVSIGFFCQQSSG